jgi:glycosyltransferase involved in cell wall biosynthesis
MESLKGGLALIEAIPRVMSRLKRPLRIIMAGEGRERPQWEARARDIERSMRGIHFEFTGWLVQDELVTLMNTSDLLVVPSLWPEPFGSVGPIAARQGLPAAAFAVGGIPQWLADGISGHLASGTPPTSAGLADAIVRCLEDPSHHAALREGARQMAATFTMERHLPVLIEALARA